MSWGPGHKGQGLARTPQDSVSDSQNSAEQDTTQSGWHQTFCWAAGMGPSGTPVQGTHGAYFEGLGGTEGNPLVESLPELLRLVVQGWGRSYPLSPGFPSCWDPGAGGRGSLTCPQGSGHTQRQE